MLDVEQMTEVEKAEFIVSEYFNDPIGFQLDCLDVKKEYIWHKMEEVANSARDNQKTCVYACHSVSKTYEAARLVLWWLYTHAPSTVITTAPTFDQVEKILWKEIHTAHSNAQIPMGGNLTKTQLDIDPSRKWFAYGFSTKPDTVTGEATRAQGYHNKYVFIIIDEAAGVLSQIWRAFDSLLIDPNCHILAIGNPTSSTGTFADCENDPTWNCINIAVLHTPNYNQGKQIIPGVAGREFEKMVRDKYGVGSNEYAIRVMGRKPEYTAGTFLGPWLSKAEKEGRVGDIVLESTMPVYTFSDLGDMYSAWWFVQFIGQQIRLIDFYYDSEGKGLPGYSLILQEKKYRYGGHFTLPDVFRKGSNAKSLQTGEYTIETASQLGIDFEKIDLPSKDDQIRAAQDICDLCHWSEAAREGFAGLLDWRQRKNDALSIPDKPVYHDEPMKTWGRHVGDSFCGIAITYRYGEIGGKNIGWTEPEAKHPYGQPRQKEKYALSPRSL